MPMTRRPVAIALATLLLAGALFGFLTILSSWSGHPPEWLLDAYYRFSPAARDADDASGVGAFEAFIALTSFILLLSSLALFGDWRLSFGGGNAGK